MQIWCGARNGFGCLVIALAASMAQPAAAQNGNGLQALVAGRLADGATVPVIDGLVTDEVWSTVVPYTNFTQQEPTEGAPASERTEVRVLLDRRTLYIGIVAFDTEPDKIIVSQSRRDADLNNTDAVQVILDTFNDNQNGFVFGTNPLGIEYDGQVAGEGLTGGFASRGSGASGSQRGQISGFNANWDADWVVKARVTERGWETEMAIPLKTLRYNSGSDRTWGFNVMRNIRRKNEQVFLAPVPRGYSLHRVSVAAKLSGLDLPPRRDIKATPFVAGSVNKDYTVVGDQLDRKGDIGLDLKWGVRPNLTADFTINTDFAQVEADEEQINLTRFPLFFPEKRGFFLENASVFQFGIPQQVDLFFSRRIGLSSSGIPIEILGGARLSGKVGAYNVGVLNMQTEKAFDPRTGALIAPSNNFTVARVQREVGRSNFGGIIVNREGTGSAAGPGHYNRAYGVDAAVQTTENAKVFAFLARTDSPGDTGSDYSGRLTYTYANTLFNGHVQYAQVGDRFNAEAGFVPRTGYRQGQGRLFLNYQPKRYAWIRRFSPHVTQDNYYALDGRLQTSRGHYHFFEIQPADGGRFGMRIDRMQDRPERPFVVFSHVDGRRVVIAPDLSTWNQWTLEYFSNPSAPLFANAQYTWGGFYDGDSKALELTVGGRLGSRFNASVGYNRDAIELPGGHFTTVLLPVRVSYSFTTLASVQGLIQYNSQTSQLTSNIRLALLDRSGTGLFVVYNDRRDTSDFTPDALLGQSFIVKYTRLLDW